MSHLGPRRPAINGEETERDRPDPKDDLALPALASAGPHVD